MFIKCCVQCDYSVIKLGINVFEVCGFTSALYHSIVQLHFTRRFKGQFMIVQLSMQICKPLSDIADFTDRGSMRLVGSLCFSFLLPTGRLCTINLAFQLALYTYVLVCSVCFIHCGQYIAVFVVCSEILCSTYRVYLKGSMANIAFTPKSLHLQCVHGFVPFSFRVR